MDNNFQFKLDEGINYDIKKLAKIISENLTDKIDELTENEICSMGNFRIILNDINMLAVNSSYIKCSPYGNYLSSKNSELLKCIEKWTKQEYDMVRKIKFEEARAQQRLEALEKEDEIKNEYDFFIRRKTKYSDPTSIFWSIDDKSLEVHVNIIGKPIFFVTFLKVLLRETNLYTYSYKRISPFKIHREYDVTSETHQFYIEFLDAKNSYERVIKNIATIKSRSMQISGEHVFFIPDLLELCVDRKILKREGFAYKLEKRLEDSAEYYREDNKKIKIKDLQMEGFIIPSGFNINKFNKSVQIKEEVTQEKSEIDF